MTKLVIKKYIDDSSDDESNMVITNEGWIDGYEVAERMLEGLPIQIKITDEGQVEVSAEWPGHINSNYFIELIKEMVVDGDIDMMSSTKELNDDNCILMEE